VSAIGAMLAAGVPPFGLGYYAREAIEPRPAWRFVAVNAWRSDARELVAQARERGAAAWLYGTPEHFRPDTFRDGLARLERLAGELEGVTGVIADPEGEWPELSSSRRAELAAELGAGLGALARSTRVGVTSYPSWPGLEELARAAGRGVWGSPQIYGRTANDAETFARWFDMWRAHFGARCIPSIAGWASSPGLANAEGFRAYLARLPRAAGAIAWDATGRMPSYIADALEAYSPGGSELGTAGAALLVLAQHPPFMLAIVVVVVAVAAAVVGAR